MAKPASVPIIFNSTATTTPYVVVKQEPYQTPPPSPPLPDNLAEVLSRHPPSSPPPQPESQEQKQQEKGGEFHENAVVKSEPQNGETEKLAIITLSPPPLPPPERDQAQLLNSVDKLAGLANAIAAFQTGFEELQKHIAFIQHAIELRSQQPRFAESDTVEAGSEAGANAVADQSATPSRAGRKSELVLICERMQGRGLRKYIVTHLSDVQGLRREVPPAMKCAPNPAKLVMEIIGRFYLQGSKAYVDKKSPMVSGRHAAILALEFFLLMVDDGFKVQIDAGVKQEAELAAVAWKKRIVCEGGLWRANESDARGLLLFVGCFGIPKGFKHEDIWDLVRSSNTKEIAEALRKSHVLVAKISDIIERMMKSGMKIEAVDVAHTFGIEDKFPVQKLLASFLRESNEALKRRKRETSNSPFVLIEASQKFLAALKSVIKFLDDRKLDAKKILPGWQLKEMIIKLQKDISDLNKGNDSKVLLKRKHDEREYLNNLKIQEAKRAHFAIRSSPMISSPRVGLHEQRAAIGESLYNDSMEINLVDSRFSGHANHQPAATSAVYRADVGCLPENAVGTMAGGASVGLHGQTADAASLVNAQTSYNGSIRMNLPDGRYSGLANNYSVATLVPYVSGTGSLAENGIGTVAGGTVTEAAGNGLSALYGGPSIGLVTGVHRDMPVDGAGQTMVNGVLPYGLQDAAVNDMALGQNSIRQPAAGLFGPSPAAEGFPGLLNYPLTGARNLNSAEDLYRFADDVVESEYGTGAGSGPHHSSYMYANK